jgi:hypothetical protein
MLLFYIKHHFIKSSNPLRDENLLFVIKLIKVMILK